MCIRGSSQMRISSGCVHPFSIFVSPDPSWGVEFRHEEQPCGRSSMEFAERQSKCTTDSLVPKWPAEPHTGAGVLAATAATTANTTAPQCPPRCPNPLILSPAAYTRTTNTLRRERHRGRRHSASPVPRACARNKCSTTNARAASPHVSRRPMGSPRVARAHQERRP